MLRTAPIPLLILLPLHVQFFYEWYEDKTDGTRQWYRTYGLEVRHRRLSTRGCSQRDVYTLTVSAVRMQDWTFDDDGLMRKRQMSGNDVAISESDRWYKDGVDVNTIEIGPEHL